MRESVHGCIDNASVRLYYERRGHGPQHVLFAHGWISSRRMWYDVVERLDEGRFTAHLFDFRGCGLSDRPRDGHDLEGYFSDLRAVLASIEAPVTLVGHSMGGKLALFAASYRPANLSHLVLVAPGSARASRPSEKHRALALAAYGTRAGIERFQLAAMARHPERASMERIIDDALIAQWEHWIGWYDRGRAVDFAERLNEIDVPTLVVAGAKDPLAQPARLRADTQTIAGAVFVQLRHAGHNLPVEMPAEVASAVSQFAR